VWWALFTLLAFAMAFAWAGRERDLTAWLLLAALAVNLVLNATWSYLFFTRQDPALALRELVALWVSVAALAAVAWPRSRVAAALLLPYLLWVTFAGFLNGAITRLNPGA